MNGGDFLLDKLPLDRDDCKTNASVGVDNDINTTYAKRKASGDVCMTDNRLRIRSMIANMGLPSDFEF